MQVKKRRKTEFLRDMLNWVERGETRRTISKLTNMSNQALSYHFCTLKRKGFIEEVQRYPCGLYRLTSLGSRVKEIIGQSDSDFNIKMWRCHNLILGWRITDFGVWQFNPKLTKEMRGWRYQELLLKRHKIHIQDTGLLKIYCPEVYVEHNADEGFDRMVEEAQKVADYVHSKFNMELEERYRVRNGQKELIGSEKIAEMLGHMKVGGVFIDISDLKNRRLEAEETDYSLEKLLSLPDLFDKKFVPAIEQLTDQIQLHLKVLAEMSETLKMIREELRGKK